MYRRETSQIREDIPVKRWELKEKKAPTKQGYVVAGRGEEGDTPGEGTTCGKGPAPSQILYPVNSRPTVSKEVLAPAVNTKIHGCSIARVLPPRGSASAGFNINERWLMVSTESQPADKQGWLYSPLGSLPTKLRFFFSVSHWPLNKDSYCKIRAIVVFGRQAETTGPRF